LKLPPLTYGITGIVCIEDNKLMYATTAIYEIDLDKLGAKKIMSNIYINDQMNYQTLPS